MQLVPAPCQLRCAIPVFLHSAALQQKVLKGSEAAFGLKKQI